MSEEEVFEQEVSKEELENAAGGRVHGNFYHHPSTTSTKYGCTKYQVRNIYEGGFPNCAATVEDGSFCYENDACFSMAVNYSHMESCSKAWQ